MRDTVRIIHWKRILVSLLMLLALLSMLWIPSNVGQAAPVLTLTPISWNVVGLDASDVTQGPNTFLVGARVCNMGTTTAVSVRVDWLWDAANTNINLTGPATQQIASLTPGACLDVYFNVIVTRVSAAINTGRAYHIEASTSGAATASTTANAAVFVAPLTPVAPSGGIISPFAVTGPASVFVGGVYQYVGTSVVASPGLQQIVHMLDFPTDIFRIISVQTEYTLPSTSFNNSNYANACGWDSDTTSPTYLSCIGPENYPGGMVGGSTVTTYTVQVTAPGIVNLSRTVYGYIGGVFPYQGPPSGDTLVITAVTQDTDTPTPTDTGTVTPTITGTISPTVTSTPTATFTVTGTPPTSTVTGTITPNPSITNAVTPSGAKVDQNFTFTIRVNNGGTATATSLIVRSTYSTYLTITSATTTKGTAVANTSTNTVTTDISSLSPGESATITVVGRVNSTATTTVNLTNQATLTYSYLNFIYSRSSNIVFYQVIGSSTLPGTGGLELKISTELDSSNLALSIGLLLGALGIALLLYSLRAKTRNPYWADWFVKTGVAIFVIGVIFGLVSLGMRPASSASLANPPVASGTDTLAPEVQAALERGEPPIIMPEYPFAGSMDDPAELPEYPIPAPTLQATPGPAEKQPDTSAANRIVIPALSLDTVVKYVPYDGYTWSIGGLHQEIAWMGDTSWPGLGGNTAMAGHVTLRTGAEGPFRYLSDLAYGDEIWVYTDENQYVYQVREQRIVEEGDMSVVSPSDQSHLTLITCTGWNDEARQYINRLVVVSELARVEPLAQTTQSN